MLAALLEAQEAIHELAPAEAKGFELIGIDDLEEIRRIWVSEKHEIEDTIPGIYKKVTGKAYPGKDVDERQNLKVDDLQLLEKLCDEQGDPEGVLYQLTRELLHIEHQNRTLVRRKGLFDEMRKSLKKAAFTTEKEALEFAQRRASSLDKNLEDDISADEYIIASDQERFTEVTSS
jgi:DNA sulfur modification protein DndC